MTFSLFIRALSRKYPLVSCHITYIDKTRLSMLSHNDYLIMVLLGHFLGKNSVPNVDRKPNWMLRTDWFYSKRRRIWKFILLPEQQARWINVKIVKLPLVISSASSGTVMEKNSYHRKLMKCYHNEVLAHYPIWKLLCVQDYCTWNQRAYIDLHILKKKIC